MGNESNTAFSLWVVAVDTPWSLLFIKGAIPGRIGGLVQVKDAFKKIDRQYLTLWYPTYFPKEGEDYIQYERWEGPLLDPQEQFEHENADPAGPEEAGGKDEDDDDDVL